MGQTCHTGGTGGGVDSPPPSLLCYTEGVNEKIVTGGFSVRTLSLSIPPQGTSIGKGWSESTPYTSLVSHPYPDFLLLPPSGGEVGWPRRAQLRVAAANGLRETRSQGRIHIQGNVPYGGVSHYMRFTVPSLAYCRPPFTMCGGGDMSIRTCSLSSPCWSGGPLGRRGPSGHQTLPEGGLSLATRRFHWLA